MQGLTPGDASLSDGSDGSNGAPPGSTPGCNGFTPFKPGNPNPGICQSTQSAQGTVTDSNGNNHTVMLTLCFSNDGNGNPTTTIYGGDATFNPGDQINNINYNAPNPTVLGGTIQLGPDGKTWLCVQTYKVATAVVVED